MGKKVFVVDDERIIADTLTAILKAAGHEARAFYDGTTALLACEGDCPDCIISDVVMPGLSGTEMAIVALERFPGCQVILFSGQGSTSGPLQEAREEGYQFDVLLKPVHPRELLARLEEKGRGVERDLELDMRERLSA